MIKQKNNRNDKILNIAKSSLKKLLGQTSYLAKKGEKHIIDFSKLGKFEFDILNLHLKKENLCRELGEKVAYSDLDKKIEDYTIRKLISEIQNIDSEIKERKSEVDKITKLILKK